MNQKSLVRMTGQIFNIKPQLSDLTFNHNDVYSGPVEIEKNFTNLEVRIPSHCWLVLAACGDDRAPVFGSGIQYLGILDWGNYQAYLVSQLTQTLNLDEKKFITADGWNVTLSVSISWYVQDPRRITKLLHPVSSLERLCLTAITATIQRHFHDDLVGVVTQSPKVYADALSKEINDQITRGSRLYGMVIEQVSVCDIRGDDRLVNPQLDARATESALKISLTTLDVRAMADQKEATARLAKAEIDRKTQIIENQGLVAAKDIEFRRNLALKLASILPELLKNNAQGVGGNTLYAPQSAAIIEATLQRIEAVLQSPNSSLPQAVDSVDGYQEMFKLNSTAAAD